VEATVLEASIDRAAFSDRIEVLRDLEPDLDDFDLGGAIAERVEQEKAEAWYRENEGDER
jgi:hypothetical protein